MEKNIKYLYVLKAMLITILFTGALYFENAAKQRLITLFVIFIFFFINTTLKYFMRNKEKLYLASFLFDILLVFSLEQNSRLLINYFFHSFYIIIVLESTLLLSLKKGLSIGVITVIISIIKYAYLIYYKFNLSSVSQMAFFLMVNILILSVATFAQYNKSEREKKDVLYKEVLDAHKKLKSYTEELKRLSIIEERNRIARDIHDNLGHNMTALIMQLQMAEHYLNKDNIKSEELIKNSIQTAKDGMKNIREVVETLRVYENSSNFGKEINGDKAEYKNIDNVKKLSDIKKLIEEFAEKTGVEIHLNIKNEDDRRARISFESSKSTNEFVYNLNENNISQNSKINTALYHILQECLTNAVRHGKSTKIWIEINITNNLINFSVKDNGSGAENIKNIEGIKEGYGLKGIRERVEAFRGNIEYCFNKDHSGFLVKGILYLEEIND